jgi:hypothetical protein
LTSAGACNFNCQTGLTVTSTTCGTCSDSNCLICTKYGTSEHCGVCAAGFYLDLTTYTCVAACPTMSLPIITTNTRSLSGSTIQFCRPYNNSVNNFTFWVNPNSTSYLELGTYEHPFKRLDAPARETLNFMYSKLTNVTVFVMRGTDLDFYYGVAPIVLLNVNLFMITTYGKETDKNPYVWIRNNPYQYAGSTIFSLYEK